MSTTTLDDLESAARSLEPPVRAELIRRLLQTLESDVVAMNSRDWINTWSDEAEARDRQLDSGDVAPLDGPATLQKWRERYP